MMGRWLKLLTINVAVTAALLLIPLLAVEAYLRATIPASSGGSLFESTTATRRYKVMKPNTVVHPWGSELRTNRLGFRDNDSELPPKAPSAYRVIVLGDSFTLSAGVDFDRIYTSLLDSELGSRLPGTEVISLAVGGYNIVQYELVLEEVGLALQPDMVLVAVFPFNDLSNDTYRANVEEALGRRPAAAPPRWYQDLYVYGAFLRRAENRIRGMLGPAPSAPDEGRRVVAAQDARENLEALDRIVATAERHQLDTTIVLLPNTDTFDGQRGDFAPFVQLCRQRGWNCLNLLERFIAAGDDPVALRLNLLDFHPNDLYNRRVADAVRDELAARITASKRRASQ
jgi:hypothetical protein